MIERWTLHSYLCDLYKEAATFLNLRSADLAGKQSLQRKEAMRVPNDVRGFLFSALVLVAEC